MRTAILINEIIDSIEELVQNIKKIILIVLNYHSRRKKM